MDCRVPRNPWGVSQGETKGEALENIADAIGLCWQVSGGALIGFMNA